MVEEINTESIEIKMRIDTNKATYQENFNSSDYESTDDLFEAAKEWYDDILESIGALIYV